MKKVVLLLSLILSLTLQAQNIFPVKLSNCKTASFCLDCGDIKAGFVESFLMKNDNKKSLIQCGRDGMYSAEWYSPFCFYTL